MYIGHLSRVVTSKDDISLRPIGSVLERMTTEIYGPQSPKTTLSYLVIRLLMSADR